MAKLDISGIIPPMPTPTKPDGSVNLGMVGKLVSHVTSNGCKGVIVFGGTGESGAFTVADRAKVVGEAVKAMGGKGPVVAGVVTPYFQDAVATGRELKAAGADVLLVVPPTLERPSQQGIRDYYKAYKEKLDMPIMTYDEPHVFHCTIDVQTHANTVADGSVDVIKCANKDVEHFNLLVGAINGRVPLLAGTSGVLPVFATLGAVGGTIGNAALLPATFVEIFNLAKAGNLQEAIRIHRSLSEFVKVLQGNYKASFKAAFKLLGMDCGDPQMPTRPLSAAELEKLAEAFKTLQSTGVLKEAA
jgi:4-hydroxy-tetrahydrodipicolinate synthase